MADTTIPLKQCSRKDECINPLGSWLPATMEQFAAHPHGRLGLQARCRACHNAVCREIRKRDDQRQKDRERKKTPKYKAWKSAYMKQKQPRETQRKYNQVWMREKRAADPENARLISRVTNAVRRARKQTSGGIFTKEDVALLLKSQNNKCWWCECEIDTHYHLDHRIPLSRGGTSDISNIVASCITCNLQKQNKLPSEWNGRLL